MALVQRMSEWILGISATTLSQPPIQRNVDNVRVIKFVTYLVTYLLQPGWSFDLARAISSRLGRSRRLLSRSYQEGRMTSIMRAWLVDIRREIRRWEAIYLTLYRRSDGHHAILEAEELRNDCRLVRLCCTYFALFRCIVVAL